MICEPVLEKKTCWTFSILLETYKYKNVTIEEFKEFLRNKNYEALDESFFDRVVYSLIITGVP